jgi:hypothetical protein
MTTIIAPNGSRDHFAKEYIAPVNTFKPTKTQTKETKPVPKRTPKKRFQ